ncbi:unnamed protein product, partial [Hapterophycus canaliculatus]
PLRRPFPFRRQFDGYTAAVPSKHDLASFVRSIHAELALAADLTLLPLLLKGVVQAARLFCAKAEAM